jgi:hypothetical protein
MQEIPATDGHSANPRFQKEGLWNFRLCQTGTEGQEMEVWYFDLETSVLEPLENPFGPKVLPM